MPTIVSAVRTTIPCNWRHSLLSLTMISEPYYDVCTYICTEYVGQGKWNGMPEEGGQEVRAIAPLKEDYAAPLGPP